MAVSPPPIQDPMGTARWLDWFHKISVQVAKQESVDWPSINFTGSNITDIVTRQHNDLQSKQGGTTSEYYHLTQSEHSNLTGNSVKVPSYTVAGVPSASTEGAGAIIFVSNESGGAVLAFSDGTNWRRVTDRAIIS